MSQIILPFLPNPLPASYAPGDTSAHFCGFNSSGVATSYATLAAITAAGGRTYPGLDRGGKIGGCMISSLANNGAAGGGIYFALDRDALPSSPADFDDYIASGGQKVSLATPFRTLCYQLETATDRFMVDGRW